MLIGRRAGVAMLATGFAAVATAVAMWLALGRPDVLVLMMGIFSSADIVLALVAGAAAMLSFVALALARRAGAERCGLAARALLAGSVIAAAATSWHRWAAYGTRTVRFNALGATLAGTLYVPRGGGTRPAVVITPGSGALRREFYRLFADRMARAGFVVLAYDKRGIGASGGHYEAENNTSVANLDTLARDLAAAVDWLAAQTAVAPGGVGVWGISQGGWVAPLAAGMTRGVRWIVLVSGPAVTTREENVYSDLAGESADHLGTRPPRITADEADSVLDTLTSGSSFDPAQYLAALDCPALWIFGSWDSSIPARRSARRLEALARTGRRFTVRMLPEAGHLMLVSGGRGRGPLPTFAPGFWRDMLAWMRAQGTGLPE